MDDSSYALTSESGFIQANFNLPDKKLTSFNDLKNQKSYF